MDEVPVPTSAVAVHAADAAAAFCSPALVHHNHRSYLWSAALGVREGVAFDAELLYVAAMLHDLGLVPEYDNATLGFEVAGGHVGWMFAAGAGWPVERRVRVAEVSSGTCGTASTLLSTPRATCSRRAPVWTSPGATRPGGRRRCGLRS